MKRFARALVVVLGLAVLGAVVSLVPQKNAAAVGGAPVTIMNTAANAVPVTGTVSATVSGTVGAQQSGNWNVGLAPNATVGINGTPSVSVINGVLPTQNIGGGAATQVGQIASQLVNLACDDTQGTLANCFQIASGGNTSSSLYAVPKGQALIITDMQWLGTQSTVGQGNYDTVSLSLPPSFGGVSGGVVAHFSSQVDGKGNFYGQIHLATGIVIPLIGLIAIIANVPATAGVQGYLVPNQ